ncbi:MAG: MBOAT family O-acyltransferase [Desulfovibrio sp.]
MLFNSLEFILYFFPAVLFLFFATAAVSKKTQFASLPYVVLLAASTIFYSWWDYHYLWLLGGSICVNFLFGKGLLRQNTANKPARPLLITALIFNLSVLGYYKYTNFFIDNINALAGTDYHLQAIILPLGISFFTFTQIAFLVDIYRKHLTSYSFLQYASIVTFFPHLIAGPILFHHSMLPQLQKEIRFHLAEFIGGISIFCIGLAKKMLLADTLGGYADPIFNGVAAGFTPGVAEAWRGAMCYTLQIYYDFSGYSDMAIGLALCLGLRIPLNFYSPYKAMNVPDFWRRWHASLGMFLKDYLYIPLGGNRKGFRRQCINVMIIMLVCGFWHGAGWTFIAWGVLHGLFMVTNIIWIRWRKARGINPSGRWSRGCAVFVTFLCVVAGWVLFRADSLSSAMTMLGSMVGIGKDTLRGVSGGSSELFMVTGLLLAWIFPNAQQIFYKLRPSENVYADEKMALPFQKMLWNPEAPSLKWAFFIGCLFAASLSMILGSESAIFLYFQF